MTIATNQPIQQTPVSFGEFLAHYGSDNRYELIVGWKTQMVQYATLVRKLTCSFLHEVED